ncbi:MAG: SAM-dependent methyltransferase [Pseudobdellovibrio sp.]
MDYSLLHKKLQLNFDVLIPFLRYEKELENELLLSETEILFKDSKYIIVNKLNSKPLWAQEWLSQCRLQQFENKSAAIKALKGMPNLGVHFETDANAKLAESLKKELRELKLKRIELQVPSQFNFKYFAWGLFDSEHLIICDAPKSQFPLGWHEFNEDKSIPPNRAYLKVWEVLCMNYIQLKPDDVVIDVGSSPGGWSWALSQYVKKVYSIDKAELDPKIASNPKIHYASEDAFAVKPNEYKDCTWLFSDIICTPQRLLGLIDNWHNNSDVKNFVCTIKFKGNCDFDILKEFTKYENSRIIHLYQNKNEVTWIKQVK